MCFQWDAAGGMKEKITTRLHVEKSQRGQKAVWQSPFCDTSVSCVVCLSISYSAGVMPKLARWSGQTTSEGRREPCVLGFCIRFCLKDLSAHSRTISALCCRSGLTTEWQLTESRCGCSCILPHPKQGSRLELMVANRTACFSCFTDLPTWGVSISIVWLQGYLSHLGGNAAEVNGTENAAATRTVHWTCS